MSNLFGTGNGKTVATQAVRANGLQVQASSYGQGLAIVYGRARVQGTLIWYGDFQAVEHDQQVGKGGGGGQNVSYTYSSSFQLALCESDGTLTLGKIWKDSGLVSLSDINGTFGAGGGSQAAWSHLGSPANLQYPFTAWVGCVNLLLGSSPNVPNFNFEVNGLLQFNPGASIYDADPSAIVTDLMTSTTHGIGFSYLGDLTTFHDYCLANSIFLSPVIDQETAMTDVLDTLLQVTNSNTAWSNGKLVIIPYGDQSATGNGVTYTPPTTVRAVFTDKDYVKPVQVERKPLADQYNVIRVEWIDPTNNYVTSVAEAKDEADISASIIRQSETIQAHGITNATLAQQTAQRILQRALYIRNTYIFTTTMEYVALEAGDVIELSDSLIELVNEPVRITKIAEQDNNELEITCEEFPAGVSEGATQTVEAGAGYVPNVNGPPATTQPPVIFRAPQFLVDGDVEIWIGACGSAANWGGANVLVSYDNVTYTKIGSVRPGCRYGTLTQALADSAADPDTVNSFRVALEGPGSLSGGTHAEADNLATLMLVDGELIAYSSTTLNGDGTYTLGNGYMRRQCYNTAHAAHAIGAPWMRVDDNFFRWKVDPSLVGTTVYIKLQAWNLYGGGLQSEASLTATTYVVGTAEEIPDTPPTPINFTASGAANGNLITWENPNPAAVAITSVEFSTDNATWSVLGQVQGTHYTHVFSSVTQYYYRLRARSPSFIWSAYTSSVGVYGGALDYVSDGLYAKTRGGVQTNGIPNFSAGKNWLFNPGFESNIVGTAPNTSLSTSAGVSDGWTISTKQSPWVVELESNGFQHSGSRNLYMGSDQNGLTLGASAAYSCRVYSPQLPVKGGSTLYYGGWRNLLRNQAPPAGVIVQVRIGVLLYDINGTLVVEDYPADMTAPAGWGEVARTIAVPSNAVSVIFECAAFTVNSNSTSVPVPNSGSIGDARFDDCWLYETVDSDNELADGSTFMRFYGSYMDGSRRVSTVNGGISPLGSIPGFATATAAGFAYTSTPTSVTLSWPAMQIYRADGTITSIAANGSFPITGLSASSTYTFYPYVRESDGSIQFATGYSGAVGSPACAYAGGSLPAAAATTQSANLPLSTITATTPASGTGSGGGNHYGCLHPALAVELADERTVRADWLSVGDVLPGPNGPSRITHLWRKKCANWRHVETNEGSLIVTHDHRFLKPDGEEVRACALSVGDILAGDGRNLEVRALRLSNEIGEMVRLEVEGHLYYLNGVLSHNVKP